ncbi:MAG: biopolymer transporter ExbD [Marinovum sp.]|nr:biopolymer transporter ExbD [Marinovum sp.]
MKKGRNKSNREPTIALINIVFLMLVFFMVAGTLAAPIANDVSLVTTQDLEGRAPPDTLVVHADGRLSYRGEDIENPATFWSDQPEGVARIVPDRNLPANKLVAIARDLRIAGAAKVVVVTERGLP